MSRKNPFASRNKRDPGLAIRVVQSIFQALLSSKEMKFLLRVSHFEIYNETMRDLLHDEARDGR